MEDEKLNKNGLIRVWLKIWTLLKLLVGDVDVDGKGDLQTQIDNLDNRVDECFRSASDGKELVADAITGKGVPTLVSDTFATIAANIAKIKTSANLQSKSAVLSNVAQTVKPDAGYDGLSQVSVPAVKGTAGIGDVLTGKTFSGAAGIEKAGTMVNNGAVTVDAGAVTQDDTYTYLAVPSAAFYNANSKLRTKNSNLNTNPRYIGMSVWDEVYTNVIQAWGEVLINLDKVSTVKLTHTLNTSNGILIKLGDMSSTSLDPTFDTSNLSGDVKLRVRITRPVNKGNAGYEANITYTYS